MQTISTYLLERVGLSEKERVDRLQSVNASFSDWLSQKGVPDPDAASGSFESETAGGGGRYTREVVDIDGEYAEELILRERANESQEFVTRVCLVGSQDRVFVYASVSASNINTKIAPRPTNGRCPAVLRDVIRRHGDWQLNDAALPSGKPQHFHGVDGGAEVCRIILAGQRKFPLVLVSQKQGDYVWDALDRKIASDLVGLGYVSTIDEDAAKEVSRRLGRKFACFDGAVRIYWPSGGTALEHIASSVWTPDRMLESPIHSNAEDRFRALLRGKAMSAAALSISEPPEISAAFRAQARKRLADLHRTASDSAEAWEIANSLVSDLDAAQRKVVELSAELSMERTRAENAEAQLEYARNNPPANDPDAHAEMEDELNDDEGQDDIAPGEVIFYKKFYSTPNHDVMKRRGDCGHNRWAAAHSADKAWKGVEKLEGRGDWQSFQHCDRCDGGGMWKVTW
ncbi:hypothetical protein [Stenotrophomonas maltophilia]|uniref:hypothetical protein n=1 Tax=Stenotrophomonas maltophilia TaxID=40324 RepID=UPI0013DB1384|nr:hypothetical protein [Stenotrophomonas maltophilia]